MTTSAGWREQLANLTGRLLKAIDESRGHANMIQFTVEPVARGFIDSASPDAGKFTSRSFDSDEEMLAALHRTTGFLEENNHRKTYHLAIPGVTPSATDDSAAAMFRANMNMINWLLAPIAEWWNPNPILEHVWRATLQTEWVDGRWTVFGWRVSPDGSAVAETLHAHRPREAKILRSHLMRRGFRCIVLETPAICGQVTWAKGNPCSRPHSNGWGHSDVPNEGQHWWRCWTAEWQKLYQGRSR